MKSRKRPIAIVGLLYCSAIWGSTFVIVKGNLGNIDPVVMVGYRFLLAAIVIGGVLLWQGEKLFTDFKEGFILGVVLMLLYVPQTMGMEVTSASNSAFITGLFVAWAPLLSFFFKRKPGWNEWGAVGLSLFGLWFLTGGLADMNWGDLITLLAAFTYALHVLLTDRLAIPGVNPYRLSFQQFLVVGVFSLLLAWMFQLPFEVKTSGTMWAVVFLALLPTASAFIIQIFAQRDIPPVQASLIFALEPVFAAILAWTVGGENAGPPQIIGGGLIVAGIALNSMPIKNGFKK